MLMNHTNLTCHNHHLLIHPGSSVLYFCCLSCCDSPRDSLCSTLTHTCTVSPADAQGIRVHATGGSDLLLGPSPGFTAFPFVLQRWLRLLKGSVLWASQSSAGTQWQAVHDPCAKYIHQHTVRVCLHVCSISVFAVWNCYRPVPFHSIDSINYPVLI